ISYGVMNNMVKKEMVIGIPSVSHAESVCDACLAWKQTRHSFPTKAMSHATKPLHEDLCGQITHPMLANNHEAFYQFKGLCTDRGGESASYDLSIVCGENWIEAMAGELESITRSKLWVLVDISAREENQVYVLPK